MTEYVRPKLDYYPTPSWCINLLLDYLNPTDLHTKKLLEPSAGQGHIISAVQRWVTKKGYNNHLHWTAFELDRAFKETLKQQHIEHLLMEDYIQYNVTPAPIYDLAICNPPYNTNKYTSFDFIKKIVYQCSYTYAFLRAHWISSAMRNQWLIDHPPDVYSIAHRPSFYAQGTDLSSYAWFVWQHPDDRRRAIGHRPYGQLHILPTLTAQERKQCLEEDRQSISFIDPSTQEIQAEIQTCP